MSQDAIDRVTATLKFLMKIGEALLYLCSTLTNIGIALFETGGAYENVIITGSSGLVATELISNLLNDGGYQIYAVSTNPNKLKIRYASKKNVICLGLNELKDMLPII